VAVFCEHGNEFLVSMKGREFLDQRAIVSFSRRTLLYGAI
jgi:hypothetical protein